MNRLTLLADKIISKNQSAFIKGRYILDSAVTLHEVMHEMQSKKLKGVIFKIDFEKAYGEVGKNIIHVHHLKPLSEIKDEYKVDPENDLRPVCPNCHMIIHRRKPVFSIDEVKAMLENAAHCESTNAGLIK